jgi:nicotinate-nucleotide adenylyltransferase
MRLGLFGGTFDPIHLGHLILAEACRETCALDRVWFVVSGSPPHKPGDRTPVSDRLEMARIGIAGHPSFDVSEIEAKGVGPHYSFETLEAVQRERPEDELFFLVGADSLNELPTWRRPDRIAELATIVVVNRPGSPVPQIPGLGSNARPVISVSVPPIGIASHDLRRRVAEGRSIRYQVPRGVEAFLVEHELYREPRHDS